MDIQPAFVLNGNRRQRDGCCCGGCFKFFIIALIVGIVIAAMLA